MPFSRKTPASRAGANAASKRWREKVKGEVIAVLGGACACCGEAHREFLTVDHIGGTGAAERAFLGLKSGLDTWLHVRAEGYPRDRYRLLCFNCNCARGFHGYCPHERERGV